jgi:hypothetical protein
LYGGAWCFLLSHVVLSCADRIYFTSRNEITESPALNYNDDDDDASDMGKPQILEDAHMGVRRGDLAPLILETRQYMAFSPEAIELSEFCRNEEDFCAIWAHIGECSANPDYMKAHCAPVCRSCEFTTIEGRCPLDPNAKHSWLPGDLDTMFRRLTAEPYLTQYNVTTLSSPDDKGRPWVITMDNIVSEVEAARLIELGSIEGYERSTDVGKIFKKGEYHKKVSSGRTSTNAVSF